MTFISITRLRLRSLRFLPGFGLHAALTTRQARRAPGYRGGSLLLDQGLVFWTMTAWDAQESMRNYMLAGSHRTAMPRLAGWCDEASVVHWEQEAPELPSWAEADRRMREAGRPSKLRSPSPGHAALDYRAPRLSRAAPLAPAR